VVSGDCGPHFVFTPRILRVTWVSKSLLTLPLLDIISTWLYLYSTLHILPTLLLLSLHSVAYSPDGRHIISGSADLSVRIWDSKTGATFGKPLEGHSNAVMSVTYSPDGRHIASGSDDRTIQIWDTETGSADGNPLNGHTKAVQSVTYSPDGRHIVSGSLDMTIRIWDAATGVAVGGPLKGHVVEVWSVACSPDSRHIISGFRDSIITKWDAVTGDAVRKPLEAHRHSVSSIAYSPDGCHIISGSYDVTIRIWDTATGAAVGNPLEGHSGNVNSVACSTEQKVCGEFRQGENTTKNTTGCGVLMCGEIHNKLWWDRGGYQYKVCPSPQLVVIPWAGTCSVICSNLCITKNLSMLLPRYLFQLFVCICVILFHLFVPICVKMDLIVWRNGISDRIQHGFPELSHVKWRFGLKDVFLDTLTEMLWF